jgi:hypothetical protein
MLRCLPLAVLMIAATGPASAADGWRKDRRDLFYGDLRAYGGWTTGGGQAYGLGLLCGDLSYDSSVGCAGGLVIGPRLVAMRLPAKLKNGNGGPGAIDVDVMGGQILGGLALDWDHSDQLEVVGGYGVGFGDERGKIGKGRKDDRYRQWLMEATWTHTFSNGFQTGIAVGYESIRLEYTPPGFTTATAEAKPLTVRLVVGIRL